MVRQSRQQTADNLVLRIAVQSFLPAEHALQIVAERTFLLFLTVFEVLVCDLFRFGLSSLGGVGGGFSLHLFRVPYAADDALDVFDGDGFDALAAQFVEEFGNAHLDVIDNLVAPFGAAKIVAQAVDVVLQQFVGVFVDLVQTSTQVDGDILFHNV